MTLIIVEPTKLGRRCIGDRPMTSTESMRKFRAPQREARMRDIAVLDMETDPFDNKEQDRIAPFVAELYSDQFDTIVIWDENPESFVDKLIAAIESLPRKFTIFAHNGGKFDYMFLVHKLRGFVSFKGRGIMSAKIGEHEIRDSFHIIPEKLAAFQKEAFDYAKMKKKKRNKHKQEILDYLHSDCVYLFDIVKTFVSSYGLKISIGQAAMAKLREDYKVAHIGEGMDAYLRQYFFGGRVECLAGRGHFSGHYKLIDVNSMYPFVMANYQHPIGKDYTIRKGIPGPHTVFLRLTCKNYGAFVKRTDSNETTATAEEGEFFTTIWEYETAKRLGLISHVKIIKCIDCRERSDFSKFVMPLYEKRLSTKAMLKEIEAAGNKETEEYITYKKDDIFYKLILNNAYGKFAQNPRRFKESYITDSGVRPPDDQKGFGALPIFENDLYCIWQRPNENFRFNNVGTAASITGAARAVLMEAIHNAVDPIYCDTDSLICRDISDVRIHPTELGAWDLEAEYSEVLIAGKKMYACKSLKLPNGHKDQYKVRSKGVAGLTWEDIQTMLDDQYKDILAKAPTLTKRGDQHYMTRRVRATAVKKIVPVYSHARRNAAR
jgi:hypothetical protein